jgi:transposase
MDSKSVCHYIKAKFKVEYTISGVTKLLRRMDFSFKKAKAYPVGASRQKQDDFVRKYFEMKNDSKIYFGDSTHAQYGTIIGKGWIKKGIEFPIFTHRNSHHKKINYNGAICLSDLNFVVNKHGTVGSDGMCSLLRDIRKRNSLEDKIVLILDNASYNKSNKVKILAEKLKISLEYLPPYSPNLNPIERLWKYFKQKVLKNIYYETFEKFELETEYFFKNIRSHKKYLKSILTDNFELMGT